jgi:hypothetical protein
MTPAQVALTLVDNSKLSSTIPNCRPPNHVTAYAAAGEVSMDVIERGFALTALTSFCVLLGAMAWLWAT